MKPYGTSDETGANCQVALAEEDGIAPNPSVDLISNLQSPFSFLGELSEVKPRERESGTRPTKQTNRHCSCLERGRREGLNEWKGQSRTGGTATTRYPRRTVNLCNM